MPYADADEGVITEVHDLRPGLMFIKLDNGNRYRISRTCTQDPLDFVGPTVRLLLTVAHRVWDISVI